MPRADVLGADAGGSPTPLVVIYGGFSGEAVQGDVFYIDPGTRGACSMRIYLGVRKSNRKLFD